ncbi:MAG: hypothetical protein E6936_14335 [Clostridium perfringens]|nr:hypothetical protein [Clostridium perfringens]
MKKGDKKLIILIISLIMLILLGLHFSKIEKKIEKEMKIEKMYQIEN